MDERRFDEIARVVAGSIRSTRRSWLGRLVGASLAAAAGVGWGDDSVTACKRIRWVRAGIDCLTNTCYVCYCQRSAACPDNGKCCRRGRKRGACCEKQDTCCPPGKGHPVYGCCQPVDGKPGVCCPGGCCSQARPVCCDIGIYLNGGCCPDGKVCCTEGLGCCDPPPPA